MKDNHSYEIKKHFQIVHQFISESEGAVFVHCLKGMSRSATIVCSFLLLEGLIQNSEEAIKYVQERHKKAYPNPSFRD